MAARNQCGGPSDALSLDRTSGVTPPLLPTLMVAVVLAAASFYCPGPTSPTSTNPAAPTSAPAAVRMSAAALPPAPDAADTAFVPSSLAFPRQFPIVVAAHVEAAARQQVALQPPHRPAARIVASRRIAAPKGVPAPAESALVASTAVEPARADAPAAGDVEDGVLPALALPFAPTIRAVARVGTFVGAQSVAAGTEAAALGDAMVSLVGRLR